MMRLRPVASAGVLFFVGLMLGSAAAGVLAVQSAASPTRSSVAPAPANGRYQMTTPAQAADSGYANFLWVLDTQTGEVHASRIVSVKDDSGKHTAWETETLLSDLDKWRLEMAQKKAAPQ